MASHPLDGTSWRLISYRDDDALRDVPEPVAVTLTFDGARLAGSSGCNRYTAQVRVDAGMVSVSAIAGTRMLCPAPHMTIERAYLLALEVARSWQREDTRLELRAAAGTTLLIFAVAAHTSTSNDVAD